MMRQMRENTKWIMLATALAFVALMVFEWGMDITGRSGMGVGEIGRVNGTPIMYEDYMATYRNLYSRIQETQQGPISTQRTREIEDQAFDEVVTQILLSQELQRRGIRVTDEEIRQTAQLSPPPELRQESIFMTEGQFDLQKYQEFIASPQVDPNLLLYLENYYRTVIPRAKLMRQLTMGMYLSDQELWQIWRDGQESVRIRYLVLQPGLRIPDSDVEVSESEARDYYDDHEEEFETPARARVQAVVLRTAPTAADTAASLERAAEVRARVEEGEEAFADVAREVSEDFVTAEQGGHLGVVPQGQMLPALDSAVFATAAGALAGPVQSPSGYHLLRTDERWGQDSARVSHILIPIQRTEDSEMTLLTLADSLETLVEAYPLSEAAGMLGLNVQAGELTDEIAFLSGAGQVDEGAVWALEEAAEGDVSPVFETAQAFYALELVSRTLRGVLPFEEVRAEIEEDLRFQKKVTAAERAASEMVERVRAGATLEQVATDAGLQVQEVGPVTRDGFTAGLGRQSPAVGAAFGLAPGEVSDPVISNQDVFIIEQVDRTPADSTAWVAQKDLQRMQQLSQASQTRIIEWLEGLRDAARVVDRRDEVLQPADDNTLPSTMGGIF
jgi:peptidyl-prolyl cis-trans isomerase D